MKYVFKLLRLLLKPLVFLFGRRKSKDNDDKCPPSDRYTTW